MVVPKVVSSRSNGDGCRELGCKKSLQPKQPVIDHARLRAILGRRPIPYLEAKTSKTNTVGSDAATLKASQGQCSSGSDVNTGPRRPDSDRVLVVTKKRSLQSVLNQFTDLSKCFVDEIAGLRGIEVGDDVTSLVKAMVCKSSLHLDQAMCAFKDLQCGKVNFGEEGGRHGDEALVNQRRLEADKMRLVADKMTLEAEKMRVEADSLILEEDNRRLQEEVEAAKEAAATYLRRIENEASCRICLTNPRSVVLLPCFHGYYCNHCIERHRKTNEDCPSCGGVIKGTIPFIA